MNTPTKPAKTIKKPVPKLDNPKELRGKLDMNQSEFWNSLDVTQSGGSRYESGRKMPKPVQHMLEMVHGKNPLKHLAGLRGMTVEELISKFGPKSA